MNIQVHIKQSGNAAALGCNVDDIITLDFEREYLPGVVAAEMGKSRQIEALRAQAIASRSYAYAGAVMAGGAISDSSGDAQAYDAQKAASAAYTLMKQAVADTAGIVLTYNGKPVKTHYTASNGGRIVSAYEAWKGTDLPYEIAKGDPWDTAVGDTKRGHGVGMSQNGAMYAAELGKTCWEILAFYYPGTVPMADYGAAAVLSETQEEKIARGEAWALSRAGGPYIFATSDQECTPALRRNRAAAKPAYAANIIKYCPVCSGKQTTCDGCKNKGKLASDCRGLTYKLAEELGIDMSSIGATSQWKDDCWAAKGLIQNMPKGMLCIVFRQDQSNAAVMKHTGICLRDGTVVHAEGHASGIVHEPVEDFPWTHYAIWKGLYATIVLPESDYVIEAEGNSVKQPTLRKGSESQYVAEMQGYLLQLGYDLGSWGADSDFGDKTKEAVQAFQGDHNLVTDGVCGPLTWAALLLAAGNTTDEPEEDEPEAIILFTATVPDLTAAQADGLVSAYPGTTVQRQA